MYKNKCKTNKFKNKRKGKQNKSKRTRQLDDFTVLRSIGALSRRADFARRACGCLSFVGASVSTVGNGRLRSPTPAHAHPRPPTSADARPRSLAHARPRSPTLAHARPRPPTPAHARPRLPTSAHARPRSPTLAHARPLSFKPWSLRGPSVVPHRQIKVSQMFHKTKKRFTNVSQKL